MSALSSALVHLSARSDASARVRHEAFIREKLVLASVALGALPFVLAFHGAPSKAEAALFALALVPLAAAMLVVRTGRLVPAQIVAAAGLAALAAVLASLAQFGAATAWLVLAVFELAMATDTRAARALPAGLSAIALAAWTISAFATGAAPTVLIAGACALGAAALTAGRLAVETKRLQADRSKGRERDAALAEVIGDAVAILDVGGSLLEASAASEALLGLSGAALAGRGLFEQVHVADRPLFLKLVADAAHEAGTRTGEIRLRTAASGGAFAEPRHVLVEMRARRIGTGRTVIALLRDITAIQHTQTAVDDARRSIDSALRSKDQFLANMSHELRTPLNAIIGFSEMLSSHTLRPIEPAKQREYARIIHQSGQHLLSVVNSILDMSKIQSGTFALLPEPFEIVPLIEQCCDMVRLEAQNGRVEVVRDLPGAAEELVADRRACKQILINLLSNAVKFTPESGRVVVRLRSEGTALRLTVSDSGIGIGGADLARLGDPFFQARSSLSRPYEGTGLGLSVVRGLVGLHGGSITIESEPGKGTSVSVRLPLDCRVVANTTSAAIETIPRRGAVEPIRPFETTRPFETRMKQSA